MDWFEIIFLVIAIIFGILRMFFGNNSVGNIGFAFDEVDLGNEQMGEIRALYEDRLKAYYKHHKPRTYLRSNSCEARIVIDKNNKTYFYCKERTDGKHSGQYFEVKGNIAHVNTMWAIFDMEFNDLSTYSDMLALYYELNSGIETVGGLRYFTQNKGNRLPKPQTNKSAQNEYCKMEINELHDGTKILLCSEIWGQKDVIQGISHSAEPRKFIIKAEKLTLYGILSEFAKEKDKMVDYIKLFYRYSSLPNCLVQEINTQKEDENREENKIVEPLKYIHVEADNKNEVQEINKEKPDSEQTVKIKKYNERNLDI